MNGSASVSNDAYYSADFESAYSSSSLNFSEVYNEPFTGVDIVHYILLKHLPQFLLLVHFEL